MWRHRLEASGLYYRSGLPCVAAGPMPSADSSCAVGGDSSPPRRFPWHATSQDSHEVSRGQSYSLWCIDAGFIKHAPAVEGGLGGCAPTRPERTTPRLRFVFLAPHLRSTLPSDPTSRRRPCASLVLRLHVCLDRGLSPPSSTTCTAHTLPITCRRPDVSVRPK